MTTQAVNPTSAGSPVAAKTEGLAAKAESVVAKAENLAAKSISPEHKEGPVAKSIEQQTAKLPSDWFLWAALGSIATSFTLQMGGKKHASTFVGQWAPTLLILGLYNKLVKQLGSDHTSRRVT